MNFRLLAATVLDEALCQAVFELTCSPERQPSMLVVVVVRSLVVRKMRSANPQL